MFNRDKRTSYHNTDEPLERAIKWFSEHIPIFTIVFCFFVATTLLILDRRDHSRFENITIAVMDVTSPLLTPVSQLCQGASKMLYRVHQWVNLSEEMDQLSRQNQRLQSRLVRAEFIESENRSLRQLLNIPQEQTAPFITARIVAIGQGSFIRSAIINAGNMAGIEKDLPVINHQGLIGRVSEVSQYAARVLLLSDVNSHIPVISSESQERAILKGNNSENMVITFLTENHKLKEGELIFTSGDGDLFPAGILAGVVSEIHPHKAIVEPAVEWHKLEHVQVLQRLGPSCNTPDYGKRH